jgi:hypothetical protein
MWCETLFAVVDIDKQRGDSRRSVELVVSMKDTAPESVPTRRGVLDSDGVVLF